ncbi:hypothetical protein HPT27_11715 [Permianibacter sp. IMCC34836]|nr:hypothetical protein [Permianibacter fluminis]
MIELLIALAIMAIGATLATPLITSLIESSRLSSVANDIVETMAIARSEAIKQGRDIQIVPVDGSDWSQGWRIEDVATNTLIRQFDAVPAGLTLSASVNIASVGFGRNGARLAGQPQVDLNVCGLPERGGHGRKVSLALSGSTTVEQIESGCE